MRRIILTDIDCWIAKVRKAKHEAHLILSKHETSLSRVVYLEQLTERLSGIPVDIQDYFKESILCLEQTAYRAAIVMSWAGHFHVYAESLLEKSENEIKNKRPKWHFSNAYELKENYPEAQIIEVAGVVRFTSKAQSRVLNGQLATRNQCAHPTLFKPSLNTTIGYVDQMIQQTFGYL